MNGSKGRALAALACAWLAGCSSGTAAPQPRAAAGVLQHHARAQRDGLFVDAALTRRAVAGLRLDPTFRPALARSTFYAQPLFFPAGPGGKDVLIVASEQNVVYALDAADGSVVWNRALGAPVPLSALPCGNIDPLGVTGTPVIDPDTRTLFVDAMTTPDGGASKRHLVFALSIDDGSVRPGWPVDVSAKVRSGDLAFDSGVQNQRGALAFLGGTVYVPYGGFFGDCGAFRGWVVGIRVANPGAPLAWATAARGGGSWAPSGIASDGSSLFLATGNTFGATSWSGGEAILRLSPALALADFFAPTNWRELDAGDVDIGGTGPVLVDVPGANPSALAVALGKDGKVYLLDRSHLGGVGGELLSAVVSRDEIINAAAAYPAASGAYVVFRGTGASCPAGAGSGLTALRIAPGSPPAASAAWCASLDGMGSPMVTTVDGRAEPIVWAVGAEGDQRLHAYDGQTGEPLFTSAPLGSVRRYQVPIAAGGRIFVAIDGGVVAFSR